MAGWTRADGCNAIWETVLAFFTFRGACLEQPSSLCGETLWGLCGVEWSRIGSKAEGIHVLCRPRIGDSRTAKNGMSICPCAGQSVGMLKIATLPSLST
jgi:hypothetical protein